MVTSFYDFHRDLGSGPLTSPVPVPEARRRALSLRSPAEAMPAFPRSRLRRRVPGTKPRAIPDTMWDEFVAAMNHDRDRAVVLLHVSSGARASELLGVTPADIDSTLAFLRARQAEAAHLIAQPQVRRPGTGPGTPKAQTARPVTCTFKPRDSTAPMSRPP